MRSAEARSASVDGHETNLVLPGAGLFSGRLRSYRVLVRVLAALLVVLAVTGAAMWQLNQRHDRREAARKDALSAATKALPRLLSYDVSNIDSLATHNAGLMTPSFEKNYAKLVAEKLAPGVHKLNLTTQTDVATGAVVSVHGSRATLLLFLDQQSRTEAMKAPASTGSRVRVVMRHADGTWKVDQVDPV